MKRRPAPPSTCGTSITKKLDGVEMPAARPTVIMPASITRAVGWAAPASVASASPDRTIMPAKYSGLRTMRRATPGFGFGRAAA